MDFSKHKPKTLQEAVDLIVAELLPEERDYILKEGMAGAHFGFGMAMRNCWGLWNRSDLAQHFRDVYGLGHADDMSGMILAAVEAKVKGTVFDDTAEAAKYQQHWRERNIDPLTMEDLHESDKGQGCRRTARRMPPSGAMRAVQIRILPECLANWLVTGHSLTIVGGIPPGARVVRAGYDHERGVFSIVVEHESFDEISEGAVIPERDISARLLCASPEGSG